VCERGFETPGLPMVGVISLTVCTFVMQKTDGPYGVGTAAQHGLSGGTTAADAQHVQSPTGGGDHYLSHAHGAARPLFHQPDSLELQMVFHVQGEGDP
jgi:hypothetical protein